MDDQRPMEVVIPKIKKFANAMNHKINADKLRDMLREKCRIRVRESRHNRFDNARQFLENEKKWLTSVLRGELSEFEIDLALEDAILKEIIDEQYQWMIEQYEESINAELSNDPMALQVMCPICQVAELKLSNQLLRCSCGYQQIFRGTLEEFWKMIQDRVSKHEEKCTSLLRFFIDPNESALNMMCANCDYFSTVE